MNTITVHKLPGQLNKQQALEKIETEQEHEPTTEQGVTYVYITSDPPKVTIFTES